MATKATPLAWTTCRGRDGWSSSPLAIATDQAREVLNMHFFEGGLGTKRAGGQSVTVSGHSNHNALFGGYVPGQDETARELWMVDDSATNLIRRMAGGSTFSTITKPAVITAANDKAISWAVGNGKLFLAYDDDTNRGKVFDPGLSTTALRYLGLKKSAAPTAATIAGAGLTITRSYKTASTEQRSSVTVRRSELSAAVTLTSTDDAGIRVTRATAIGEGETHWETYGADTETGTYYLLGTTAIGTTTFDDTDATIDTTAEAAPVAGTNTPFPSCKYLLWLNERLFGFGRWETAAGDSLETKDGTLYYSAVQDSSGLHDEERISNTTAIINRISVARNAGGIDRGLNALGNVPYAFQSRGIYAFYPTGNDDVPLRRVVVSKELGALTNESIVPAVDELGRPALYFLDPGLGPYRIGRDGLQWCGKDVADVWATVNKAATAKVAHATWYPDKYQIWFWIATGSSNDPDVILCFDHSLGRPAYDEKGRLLGVTGGWAKWTGTLAEARCSTLMSRTLGATMSRDLVPYAGLDSGTVLLRGDTGTQDNGDNYQAYVESGALGEEDYPLSVNKALTASYLEAEAGSGVTITQTAIRNLGDETNRTSTVLLTAAGSETEVLKRFEDASVVDLFAGQIRLGDATAANTAFTLNRWEGWIETRGQR